jgi:hypothetical protein
MGVLKKISYTHDAFIDLIIANPAINQGQIAAHFGYTQGWISNVFASDAFQARLAARREEIVDPVLKATVEEQTKALYIRSLQVLAEKLDKPASTIPDQVALRCMELGAKAMGLGGNAPPPPAPQAADRLERIAHRLIDLQSHIRQGVTYEGTATPEVASPVLADSGA